MSSLAARHLSGAELTNAATIEQRAAELVNPASGLANDYLNIFNELVMLVEQLPTIPDFMDDISGWRPVSYVDYFSRSSLPGSQSALEVYRKLDAVFRQQFESVVEELDCASTAAVVTLRRHMRRFGDRNPDALEATCARIGCNLREVLDRATHIVNHGVQEAQDNAQRRADRLLAVRIRALKDLEDFSERRWEQD